MSFFKRKYVKVIILVIALIAITVLLSKIGNNPVQRVANDIMSPVYSVCDKAVTPVRKLIKAVKMSDKYEKEIESLKKQVNELEKKNRGSEEYIAENKRLKELLDIRDSMENTKTVIAKVISYEPNSWYDAFMINKGENSGIKVGNPVVTGLGIVGKVTDTGKNWARISTVLNIGHSVGVKLSRTGDIGVVSGDSTLAENKECKLEYLSNDKQLINGDILLTSGLGGIYPENLMVGKVKKINSDSAGNLEYAVIEPSVDFSALYEVMIITQYEQTEEN